MVVLERLGEGFWNAIQMAWEVGWALVLGFLLSGIVQAWIPRERVASTLGGRDLRALFLATGLGAGSSSCSYAATAIARSMFAKGASLAAAMVFQFASTNLEIGIVLWVFLGWQFTLAEFVGGLVLVTLMWAGVRLLVARWLEAEGRAHAEAARAGHEHTMAAAEDVPWRARLTSLSAWSDVAHNFRGDWRMLWKRFRRRHLLLLRRRVQAALRRGPGCLLVGCEESASVAGPPPLTWPVTFKTRKRSFAACAESRARSAACSEWSTMSATAST